MNEPARKLLHTFAEYVALDAGSETRHELVNGEIFAMAVSQHERRIEHYHRNDDDTWTLRDVRAGGSARLDAIGCELAADAVYDDPLAAAPAAPPAARPPASRPKRTSRRKRAR